MYQPKPPTLFFSPESDRADGDHGASLFNVYYQFKPARVGMQLLANFLLATVPTLRRIKSYGLTILVFPLVLVSNSASASTALIEFFTEQQVLNPYVLFFLLLTAIWILFDQVRHNRQLTQITQDLRKERERSHTYLDTAQTLIVGLDPQGRITLVNPYACKLLGYQEQDLLGRNWFFTCQPQPEGMKTQRPLFLQVMKGEVQFPHTFNGPLQLRDGSIRVISWRTSYRQQTDGTIQSVLASGIDITEHRQAERALKHSEQRLKVAGKVAYDLIYEWDVDTDTLTWFGDIDGLLGFDKGSISYSIENWLELIHPEDQPQLAEAVERHRNSTGRISYEYRIRHRDGNYRYWNDQALPLLGEDGKPYRWVGVCTDQTVRKEAEQAKAEANRRFRQYFDQSLIGAAVINRELQWIEVNDELCKILGYSKDQLLEVDWMQLHHPNEHHHERSQFLQLLNGEQDGFHSEKRFIHADGSMIHSSQALTCLRDSRGEIEQFIVFVQDISARVTAEAALKESEFLFRSQFQMADLALSISNAEGLFLQVNDYFCNLLGYTRDELLSISADKLLHEEDLGQEASLFQRMVDGDIDNYSLSKRYLTKSGELRYLMTTTACFRDKGAVKLVLGSGLDITQQKLQEEQLKLSASVFSHAQEGIMITDADANILDVNQSFCHITGYNRIEVIGSTPSLLKSDRHPAEYYKKLWMDLYQTGQWSGEFWNRTKSGELIATHSSISAIRDEDGNIRNFVGMFSDITQQKSQQQQLEHIAHYDALTGLPNRILLADRLQVAMAHSQRNQQRLAVGFLDLDGFKAINDSFGHDAGDHLLTVVSERLKHQLRNEDTIARLGGDEFAIVLQGFDSPQNCTAILDRLLIAAAQPVLLAGNEMKVSASLGVAFYPQLLDVDADQLIRQADQAMYQAKLTGKNRYCLFDIEQDADQVRHHESLLQIERALDQDQFVLRYQPKVNMRSGKLIGCEALVRWQHPEQGLLPPSQFLPEIENHPLAVKLGEWVIAQALQQMARWDQSGLKLNVSVNISAYHLQQQDFVDRLIEMLANYPQLARDRLELEVLETSALDDVGHATSVIQACRKIGVRFALDDFGTGYSSLTYLKQLPADQLKIDQSFVRDMLEDPDDLAILEGVLGLAAAFRRETIAEGVETFEHGRLLLQLGCEQGQGFAIAKPMPAEQIFSWIQHWQPFPSWRLQQPVARDLLDILFAMVEVRAWVKSINAYSAQQNTRLPPLDPSECHFGKWLRREGYVLIDDPKMHHLIDREHIHMHELAAQALEQQQHFEQRALPGEQNPAIETLQQMEIQGHQLNNLLQQLLDQQSQQRLSLATETETQ